MRENAIAALFVRIWIMSALMQHFAFGGQAVFSPLLFNVDERPLPRTEAKVLNARYGEEVLLAKFRYPMTVKETPCGIALSSMAMQ